MFVFASDFNYFKLNLISAPVVLVQLQNQHKNNPTACFICGALTNQRHNWVHW